jgi:hypothetical protein
MSRASLVALALLGACEGEPDPQPAPDVPDEERDESLNIELQSEAGGTTSHNTGLACMHCHQPHGDGPGLFTAAGSVYRTDGSPASAGAVQLWTADGALVIEIPIDTMGNFYTTAEIGLPDVPVLPVVLDAEGQAVTQMPWPTESASCNQCHTPVKRVVVP